MSHRKKHFRLVIALLTLLAALPCKGEKARRGYDVAAYLYPAYAADDPRLRPFWPSGMGEWETVLTMQKRNPGHYWDRRPLWGPVNEADPAVMEMEIDQAADHGINVFIFDWYWYDGRPFMETVWEQAWSFLPLPSLRFFLKHACQHIHAEFLIAHQSRRSEDHYNDQKQGINDHSVIGKSMQYLRHNGEHRC